MNRKVFGFLAGLLLAGALCIVPGVRADQADQASRLSFSVPVQIPGNRVLPAGTYWFEMLNPQSGSSVVKVMNANRTDTLALLLTNSMDRSTISQHTQLNLSDTSQKAPVTLVGWYYPDRSIGHQFIYSRAMEKRIQEGEGVVVIAQPAS